MKPRTTRLLRGAALQAVPEISAAALVAVFCIVLVRLGRIQFVVDDRQMEYLPISQEIGRALREPSVPLLAPGNWAGGAIAAEYQHGVFNVFELLCNGIVWALPLSLATAAIVLSVLHLGVLAAGVVRLAKSRGVAPALAVAAACATATSGWVLMWGGANWTPALASFAWVPWLWWSLDQSLRVWRHPMRAVVPAVFVYLALTSGWPFTDLLVVVLTIFVVLRALFDRRGISVLPAVVAWGLGLAWSAPALLMLVEYTAVTTRAQLPTEINLRWHVPASALPGFILPSFTVPWHDFEGWSPRPAVELTGGAVPIAGILAGLIAGGGRYVRRHGWDIAFLVVLVALTTTPGYALFQYSFRWLPPLMLVMSLLGAQGLDDAYRKAREGRLTPLVFNAGVLVATLVVFFTAREEIFTTDAAKSSRPLGVALTLLFAGWAAVLVVLRRWRWVVDGATVLVVLGSALLAYRRLNAESAVCAWRYGPALVERGPFDPDRRYYQAYAIGDIVSKPSNPWKAMYDGRGSGATLRPGNTMLHAELQGFNGYSPFRLLGTAAVLNMDVHGDLWGSDFGVLGRESGVDGLLGLAAVDGLVLAGGYRPQGAALAQSGEWNVVSQDDEAMVLHRAGPPTPRARCVPSGRGVTEDVKIIPPPAIAGRADPRSVLLVVSPGTPVNGQEQVFAPCQLGPIKETRQRTTTSIEVPSGTSPALVVFARPWLPGWRADLDGASLPVENVDMLFPAVRVPAGARGTLSLTYFPRSLRRGLATAAAGLLAVVAAGLWVRRRNRAR